MLTKQTVMNIKTKTSTCPAEELHRLVSCSDTLTPRFIYLFPHVVTESPHAPSIYSPDIKAHGWKFGADEGWKPDCIHGGGGKYINCINKWLLSKSNKLLEKQVVGSSISFDKPCSQTECVR